MRWLSSAAGEAGADLLSSASGAEVDLFSSASGAEVDLFSSAVHFNEFNLLMLAGRVQPGLYIARQAPPVAPQARKREMSLSPTGVAEAAVVMLLWDELSLEGLEDDAPPLPALTWWGMMSAEGFGQAGLEPRNE